MILLDTNVISELWRPQPNPQVVAWIDAQAVETLFLSVVTVAELRFGIAVMPKGRKRSTLHARLEGEVLPLFDGRLLAFDLDASHAFAALASKARTAGLTLGRADAYIAATAVAQGLTVATRDTAPFEAMALDVINPWS
ncbi:type II toxin-antitoxin system VapC family toxin [Xanthomonas axonopodis]|uniref:type II toxin-antitoxin system VapC family toxin n=1 Tax=Xanthomonas axonopodis TaxID=53413 RepID=UPI000997C6B3|nr:type II toxin-antitoxin system VapC family toxin [Xanthomonas axonopodis]OOX15372.1 plasmid stability protein StbB [Xanthomonas axonopodis pv. bauhiniae]